MELQHQDRNLLFGILAVQMDFITREALVTAMNAWVLAKHKSLGEILVEQKALPKPRCTLLDSLVDEHLNQHGNDAEKSLAAVGVSGAVREDLRQITDPQVQATLMLLPATAAEGDPYATMDKTAGGSTLPHPSATAGKGDPYRTMNQSVGSITSSGARFQILRHHAEGGLGKVSVARDDELRREVALKEIKENQADNPENRARFLLEAEITGGLEHPGIVPVYGLGEYADGRPYYAMRFIRGESLKAAVDSYHESAKKMSAGEKTVELRKLLGRFVDVCNAIGYAHSRGVLHRDLKPANIMLGPYGETLVVDWGLAKAVDRPDLTEHSIESRLEPSRSASINETQMGRAMGTPAYMSPEQAAGRIDLLGPACDIYSLGATLFYIVVGKPPFEDRDLGSILYKVQHGEFKRPREVKPEIPAPLDAICVKAMALKPSDRYASLSVMADDIEHWLADEPVSAYPEPLAARWARTIRRHKTLFAGAAALLLTAVIALTISTIFINRARTVAEDAKQKAETNFKLAQDTVDKYLIAVGRNKRLKASGLEPLRLELLQNARKFYDQFSDLKQGSSALAHSRADTYKFLGYSDWEIGSRPEAIEHYATALDIYKQLAAADPKNDGYQADVGEIEYTQGSHFLLMSKLPEAEAACLAAIKSLTPAATAHPEVVRYPKALAAAQSNLGMVYDGMGRTKEAEESYSAARKIREKLVASHAKANDPDTEAVQSDLASDHNIAGAFYQAHNRPKEAESEFQAALDLRRQLAKAHPDIVAHRSELANIESNLGLLYRSTRRFKESEDAYRAAVDIDKSLASEHPEVKQYRDALAKAYINLGNLFRATGRGKDMEAACLDALKIFEKLSADDPGVADYRAQIAAIENNLGLFYKDAGNFAAAEKATLAALQARTQLVTAMPQAAANKAALGLAEFNLGNLYKDMGRSEDARAAYQKSIDSRQKLVDEAVSSASVDLPTYQAALAESENEYGVVLNVLGQTHEADMALHTAVELSQRLVNEHPDEMRNQARLADTFNSLGVFYAATGKPKEAESALNSARDIWVQLDAKHPGMSQHDRELARVLHNLGNMYRDAGQLDKSEAAYRSAMEIRKRLLDSDPTRLEFQSEMAWLDLSMGKFYTVAHRTDDATKAYQRAADIYQKIVAEHPDAPAFKAHAAEANRLLQAVKKKE